MKELAHLVSSSSTAAAAAAAAFTTTTAFATTSRFAARIAAVRACWCGIVGRCATTTTSSGGGGGRVEELHGVSCLESGDAADAAGYRTCRLLGALLPAFRPLGRPRQHPHEHRPELRVHQNVVQQRQRGSVEVVGVVEHDQQTAVGLDPGHLVLQRHLQDAQQQVVSPLGALLGLQGPHVAVLREVSVQDRVQEAPEVHPVARHEAGDPDLHRVLLLSLGHSHGPGGRRLGVVAVAVAAAAAAAAATSATAAAVAALDSAANA